jgi:putative PIN family toxin of toxin-antitoxin system
VIRRLLLDTNIVLDWLVFDDTRIAVIGQDIAGHRAIALTHSLAIDELKRVLAYPNLDLEVKQQHDVIANYSACAVMIETPERFDRDHFVLPVAFPRCRDPDDQFLLALAYHGKTDLLISRDRQLLSLAKRTLAFGFRVVAPESYSAV